MRYSDEYGRVEMYFAASLPEPGEFSYHSTACIAARTIIGAGTKIWHFTHVMPCAQIGRDCVLGQGVHVASRVKIGNNCRIQNHVSLFTGVELADSVFIGPGAVFTNVLTPRAFVPRKEQFKQTIVEHGATIGANATILCGVTIGEYAMVGAGAVVTHDVARHMIVAGTPAKWIGWACRCGARLVGGVCPSCETRYTRIGDPVNMQPEE